MSLNNSQYDALMRQYNQKQLKHKHEQRDRIRIAYKRIPRLQEIDNEIASLSLKKARALLMPSSSADFNLSDEIEMLSQERRTLLLRNGFPADYLELHYDCHTVRIPDMSIIRNVPVFARRLLTYFIHSQISAKS